MKMDVVTVRRQTGVGKVSKKAYDFYVVGGLVTTSPLQLTEFAECVVPADSGPAPERGRSYDLLVSAYPDREKRLTFRVDALRLSESPRSAEAVRKAG